MTHNAYANRIRDVHHSERSSRKSLRSAQNVWAHGGACRSYAAGPLPYA